MIQVHPNLYVGSEADELFVRGHQPRWFVIHAAKEPFHREALGYKERGAPIHHPEYLIAERPGRLILNLVDAPDPRYIRKEIIDAAVGAIAEHIDGHPVLVHCNQGHSRSPTIALLYLAKHTDRFAGMNYDDAVAAFKVIYPAYEPGNGMEGFARTNWDLYDWTAAQI